MERLINCNDVYNAIQITTDNFGVLKGVVESNMLTMLSKIETVEAIPKADYETRLKADLVAMLTDIQLEIEKKITADTAATYFCAKEMCTKIIQQKINSLKENTDGVEWQEKNVMSVTDAESLLVALRRYVRNVTNG